MINTNDYEDCIEHFNNDAYITINPWQELQRFLFIHVIGLGGTPYEGGVFKFQIDLEDEVKALPQRILIDNNFDKNISIAEFKRSFMRTHSNYPILAIQLNFKGKVLPDRSNFNQLGIDPSKDFVAIMPTFAGRFRTWNKGKIWCNTLIWHPYIDCSLPSGEENVSLGRDWNPNSILKDLIERIKSLIHMQSFNNPLNQEAGEQYLNNRPLFDRIAKEWTRNNAMD